MHRNCLANYRKERESFARLWQEDCSNPILLFCGQSGSGKTSLLRNCRRMAPADACQIFVDCKQDGVNAAEVFSRTVHHAGRDKLPAFSRWLQQHNVEIRDNQIEGNSNQINVVLNSGSKEEREERRIMLTDAWLQDTDQLDSPILLAVDTYEKAADDLRTWLNSIIVRLPRASRRLRLVVAGQEIPSTDTCEDWADCCCEHKLFGVPEAEHWLPVVAALGLRVPVDPPLTFLAGLCHAFKGNPAKIIEVIKTFPRLS
jgi:hypothetical protein